MMEQYYNTEQSRSSLSIGYARESEKWKYPLLFCWGHQTLFSRICQFMKYLLHVPNIILGAVDDNGDYAGDDAGDNYDDDANCDYDQDYECWVNQFHLMQCGEAVRIHLREKHGLPMKCSDCDTLHYNSVSLMTCHRTHMGIEPE